MDGPRPLERLWIEMRDRMVTRLPTIDPAMLEALHGAFYAGACAIAHAVITDPAFDWSTIHEELEDFSQQRRA